MTGPGGGPPGPEETFDVPPSLPRLLVLPALLTSYGLLMVLSRAADSWLDGLIAGGLYLVGGVMFFGFRLRRRLRPVLKIDATGVTNHEGQRVHSWVHTAQVWVGPTPGRWIPRPLRFPTIVAWTTAGVEFGRRARYGPTPSLSVAVPTRLSVDELSAVIRRFTDAPLLTGADIELAELSRRLLGPADSSP